MRPQISSVMSRAAYHIIYCGKGDYTWLYSVHFMLGREMIRVINIPGRAADHSSEKDICYRPICGPAPFYTSGMLDTVYLLGQADTGVCRVYRTVYAVMRCPCSDCAFPHGEVSWCMSYMSSRPMHDCSSAAPQLYSGHPNSIGQLVRACSIPLLHPCALGLPTNPSVGEGAQLDITVVERYKLIYIAPQQYLDLD